MNSLITEPRVKEGGKNEERCFKHLSSYIGFLFCVPVQAGPEIVRGIYDGVTTEFWKEKFFGGVPATRAMYV